MNPALLITVAGPLLGAAGWFTKTMWLFWIGVAVCVITLFLNIASGVMKLPVLPVLFMAIGAAFSSPWYVGLGVGLLAWTTLESVNFAIAYPNSWAAAEGERPNIVQKFVSEGCRGLEMAMIITKELPLPPGTVLTNEDLKELLLP